MFASDSLTGHNFFFSSGDRGTFGCGPSSVKYPAFSPYATGVGGTAFNACGSPGPNPITSYPGEVAWCYNSTYEVGSGGGLDTGYSTPGWQQQISSTWGQFGGCLAAGTCRGVPDVAGPADPSQSGAFVCADSGQCYQIGGTSEASPIWAGFLADIDADFAAQGRSSGVGPVNAELYTLAYNPTTYARDFHDITSGTNGGYNAATGWDPVTGLGSPDIANLETDWFNTKAGQVIDFGPLPDKVVFDPPFTVSATADSGLTATFTATGECSAGGTDGATITLSGVAGSCTVTAHQAGDDQYSAAPDVSQSFNIAQMASQTISFGGIATQIMGNAPVVVSATASSGLTVNFTATGSCSSGGGNGATITLTAVGSCTVTAHQSGNNQYNPAPDVSQAFSIVLPGGWTQVAPTPSAIASNAAASAPCEGDTAATCLYTVGGWTSASVALNTVQMFNPGNNTWTQVASMGTARVSPGAASAPCYGNPSATCLYAIGGENSSLTPYSSVEMYNPSTNGWTTVASLGTARSDFGAASGPCEGNTSATCIYAIGGLVQNGDVTGSMEMYNPSANTWSPVASAAALSDQGAASGPCSGDTSATCIYSVGGAGEHGQPLVNYAEMYNPSNNAWTALPGMGSTRAFFAVASGPCQTNVSNTCVYAIGGETQQFTIVNSAEMYDPTTGTWSSTVEPMSTTRAPLAAASGPCQGNTGSTCVYAIRWRRHPRQLPYIDGDVLHRQRYLRLRGRLRNVRRHSQRLAGGRQPRHYLQPGQPRRECYRHAQL